MAVFLRSFLSLAVFLPLLFCGCGSRNEAIPFSHQGVIDLSRIDLNKSGPVSLNGDWEFYWGRLLTPGDFRGPNVPVKTGYLSVPGSWNDARSGNVEFGRVGSATLRLRVLTGPEKTTLALRLIEVYAASRLWVNGQMVAENGVVGRNSNEETPNPSAVIARFRSDGSPLDIILQISNHHYHQGGVLSPIRIGTEVTIEREETLQWGIALFFVGGLFVMGIYHLVLFAFRRKSLSPLYFGLYCLLWMGSFLVSNLSGWPIRLLAPTSAAMPLFRIDLTCFILSVPVIYLFLRSLYPGEFSTRVLVGSCVIAAGYVVLTLVGSILAVTTMLPGYYLFCVLLILYCLLMLNKARAKGRDGAAIILTGFFIFGLISVHDMLIEVQVIHSIYLIQFGMFILLVFQALALSLRLSKAFSAAEQMSVELEGKNAALKTEMTERTRLERKIIDVSEDERRRISRELHDGLCQQLTGARLRCSALERQLPRGGAGVAELGELSSLLEESVNHAYDLSRGLWPVEHGAKGVGPSLEELVRRTAESSGIAIEFTPDLGCEICTNEDMTQLYRVAQEAISNAVRHARPQRITVTLVCASDDMVTLTVSDDGIGRRAAVESKGGLGLWIMAHRARMINGVLTVRDGDGGGTVVSCQVSCGHCTTHVNID